jgi:hypothetical protein
LQRKILAPHGGIVHVVGQLDHPIKRIARFLPTLKDIHEQGNTNYGDEHSRAHDDEEKTAPPRGRISVTGFSHRFLLKRVRQ